MHDLWANTYETVQHFFASSPANQEVLSHYLWLIIALPLLGAFVNGVFGRWLGRANVNLIACMAVVGSFALSVICFWALNDPSTQTMMPASGEPLRYALGATYGKWFGAGSFNVNFGLVVDHLSGILLLVITGVGSLIHLYSVSYMEHDEGYGRYFAYMNLFVAMMLVLVMGDNLVLTYVGWEGVGMASYLLIGFWYTDAAKAWAGRKAFIANRVGDFAFIIAMSLLTVMMFASASELKPDVHFRGGGMSGKAPQQRFNDYRNGGVYGAGPLSYDTLSTFAAALGSHPYSKEAGDASVALDETIHGGPLAGRTWGGMLTVVMLLFLVGAAAKSAQIPLYVWLPDAMAGPTPVSALIHAATMVTAGVYLFCRLNYLLVFSPTAMIAIALIGACTALLAALIAFAQDDIKKVLAYSTVSQLGFMFMGVGMGVFWAAVLHLVTHAFFKACLFLGAGSVMHGNGDETDIKKLGGLRKEMPWTWATFGIATLAITGIVPLSGFFSKDSILHGVHESQIEAFPHVKYVVWGIGLLAALGTAFYMTRVYVLTFEGERSKDAKVPHAHESAWQMTLPLALLAVLSVVGLLWGIPYINSQQMGHQTVMENFLMPVFESGRAFFDSVNHLKPEEIDPPGWISSLVSAYAVAWVLALVGAGAAVFLYLRYFPARRGETAPAPARMVRRWAQNKFYVDELYEAVVIRPVKFLSHAFYQVIDSLLIDSMLVRGTAAVTTTVSSLLKYVQTGDAQNYAAVMALALLAGVGYALFQVLR